MSDVSGSNILITGGASGIGRLVAMIKLLGEFSEAQVPALELVEGVERNRRPVLIL